MKSIRVLLLFVFLISVLMLVGGCSKHYVDVYINEICEPVTLENDRKIDVLYFFPGDYVIFNNMRAENSVTLEFPVGMFEVTEVTIEAGHRVTLKVVADGPLDDTTSGRIIFTGTGCPMGNPEAKVGEGP